MVVRHVKDAIEGKPQEKISQAHAGEGENHGKFIQMVDDLQKLAPVAKNQSDQSQEHDANDHQENDHFGLADVGIGHSASREFLILNFKFLIFRILCF